MSLNRRAVMAGFAGSAFAALGLPAFAAPMVISMAGANKAFIKGHANWAIPTYHVNFVTSHQGTASHSVMAKARLAMVLDGPTEAIMRKLTEDAYADLRAQMTAAGLTLLSEADTQAIAAPMEFFPGNMDKSDIKAGITIGKSLKRGWVTFAPEAAPAMKALRTMVTPGGMSAGMAGMAIGKMNKAAGEKDATLVMPSLTLDFANLEAHSKYAARVEGSVGFTVLSGSPVTFQNPAKLSTAGTPGSIHPKDDIVSPVEFATVEKGGAAVRDSSLGPIVDGNYQEVKRARGDLVRANMPVWEGLVRDAYTGYNAAIVKAIRENS